jgi:hypothetical protein
MRVIVHCFALAVPAVVAPLGSRVLGRPGQARAAIAAAAVAAPTFAFGRGPLAAAWVIPWLAVATAVAARDCHRVVADRLRPSIAAASVFLAVSAASLLASRLGFTLGRVGEPIVELTAVHYGVAGYGATLLAVCAATVAATGHRGAAGVAVAASIAAPPIVAIGFVTGDALPQVGGAALLTVGVLTTAFVTGVDACRRSREVTTKALLVVCATAPVAPMALAVAWAAAQHWGVPALDIPSMARIHGTLNFAGFVVCGLIGYQRLRAAAPAQVASCS